MANPKPVDTVRTPDQVRAEFQRKGVSISAWALANNFSPNLVFEVLAGRKKAIRGDCHRIAVKLGLKHGEIVDECHLATAING